MEGVRKRPSLGQKGQLSTHCEGRRLLEGGQCRARRQRRRKRPDTIVDDVVPLQPGATVSGLAVIAGC